MSVIQINEEEFESRIKDGKVLVDCYASWCGPCKMLSPIVDEVADTIKDCVFYKLDVDNSEKVSKQYGIMSIPTLLLFENGQLVNQKVGFMSREELIELVSKT